jgi:multiple sugar transport system substrate-binding protein
MAVTFARRPGRSRPRTPRRLAAAAVVALSATALAACGTEPSAGGTQTLNWFINPDNGGQAELAKKCSAASGGRYTIRTPVLPNDANDQREQLLRRLAAKDDSIDFMSLDPPFNAEFAKAGFLRPFTEQERAEFTAGVLRGPVEGATYEGKLIGAPFWANTQLLWYRKSVARQTGVDPSKGPVTWQQLIDAAGKAGRKVDVQGRRYEGYMVWINALVESAGGSVLDPNTAGQSADRVEPAIDSPAGQAAAQIIKMLATSSAANPSMSTAGEEAARASFQSDAGGYMVNWPYVWTAADTAIEKGTLSASYKDDVGWARYPRVAGGTESAPPLGGINLTISAYSRYQDLALDAVRCLTTDESSKQYFLKSGNPSNTDAVYDDPEVRKAWPMADDIRDSLNDAAPRPVTPYYGDVSFSVYSTFHPPAAVDPQSTPQSAAERVTGVLRNEQLL